MSEGKAESPLALAATCHALALRGELRRAYALGQQAVAAAPGDMGVRRIVRAALSRGVPGWHVPMLHDDARNRCYAEAVARRVTPGMHVLEIGSGAGLVAMLAARAGARVTTCELMPTVAAAAADIVARNGLADRVTVIAKPSTELRVGIDLPERADLLVSELFDDILYGDNVLGLIEDAQARLLVPGAPIIPPRAELRCALASFEVPASRRPLGDVEGFDLSPFNLLAPDAFRASTMRARLRSGARSALPADFEAAPALADRRATLRLRSEGGRIDGIVQWIRIDFGDGIVFENAPDADPPSHWGAPVHPFAAPIETRAGETIDVSVRLFGTQLLITPQ